MYHVQLCVIKKVCSNNLHLIHLSLNLISVHMSNSATVFVGHGNVFLGGSVGDVGVPFEMYF